MNPAACRDRIGARKENTTMNANFYKQLESATREMLALVPENDEEAKRVECSDEIKDAEQDCKDALDGEKFPNYYTTCGFDFPDGIPEDCYYPMFALKYLVETYDEEKVSIPDELRAKIEAIWKENGIDWTWSKERFILTAFYPVEEDRLADMEEYIVQETKAGNDVSGLKKTLAALKEDFNRKNLEEKNEEQSPMERLKMLVILNNGKDFTKAQLAAFDGIDPEDETDGSDAEEEHDEAPEVVGRDHWTDQYDENPDEYNA